MSAALAWNELSRSHQKVLARIFGGGTTRGQDPSVVIGLHLMGYMQDDKLSAQGEELCRGALVATVQRIAEARGPIAGFTAERSIAS